MPHRIDMLDEQIRAAYKSGADIESISRELNVEPAAVKMALSDTEEFSDEDCRQVAAVIKSIALYGDNERNRLSAATYIYDVKKGYKVNRNPTAGVTAEQINILIANSNKDVQGFIQQLTGNSSRQTTTVDCGKEQQEAAGDNSAGIVEATAAAYPPQNPSNAEVDHPGGPSSV